MIKNTVTSCGMKEVMMSHGVTTTPLKAGLISMAIADTVCTKLEEELEVFGVCVFST